MKPNLVVSLCGTSCLTNAANGRRPLVNRYANAPALSAIPAADRIELERLIEDTRSRMQSAAINKARQWSAEINSLAAFYAGNLSSGTSDMHYLIHSDTWMGRSAAELVKDWLAEQAGLNVQLQTFGGLRTDSMLNFRAALGAMARWCEESLPKSGYRIVFNLTGGFKSVQGFMQTLGLFHADERVYLFEGSRELLRIPRLPVRMDARREVEKHLHTIRRLSLELPAEGDVPELYVLDIDGERTLSEWGELVWQQEKPHIYQARLWPPASGKIRFAERFVKQVEALSEDRKLQINMRMDELARFMELDTKPNPKSLNFKALQGNPYPPCTHELRAWSDGSANRMFGRFDGDVFVIERLEKHL